MFIVTWLELSISFTGEFSVREFSAGKFSGYHFQEPAKLRALRAPVPTCLTWLHAHVPTCLACLCAHVPTCLTCLRGCVLTCQRANVPCVLCVATCSRAITTDNKNKFSITCFPYIFVIVLCEIKLLYILAFLLRDGNP